MPIHDYHNNNNNDDDNDNILMTMLIKEREREGVSNFFFLNGNSADNLALNKSDKGIGSSDRTQRTKENTRTRLHLM